VGAYAVWSDARVPVGAVRDCLVTLPGRPADVLSGTPVPGEEWLFRFVTGNDKTQSMLRAAPEKIILDLQII
jgi:hypothetical protein